MITGLVNFFYPDIKKEEIKKFGLLALTLFFILGTYWILRLLKDVMIYNIAFPEEFWTKGYGREIIPKLKGASIGVVILASVIYTKLIDSFKKHQLFYIIISFYITVFAAITAVVMATNLWGIHFIGKYLLAATGIFGYLITESYGSLVIALFWSFTVSSSTSDQAKRCFPFIIAIAQIGTILGSSLVSWGLQDELLFGICLLSLTSVIFTIHYLVKNTPADVVAETKEKKHKPDLLAGIKLIFTQPYLAGVLVVSTFYEIAKTIVDYQMKSQANVLLTRTEFKMFIGQYGMWVNLITFLITLLGTAKLLKRFSLKFCLLLSPVIYGVSLIGLYIYYQTNANPMHLLYVLMVVMILITAVSYAINNPTKEMMYIPTSKDAKFKAKGLIDILGGRLAKGSAAGIGDSLNITGNPIASVTNLMTMGTLMAFGIVAAWFVAAMFVGIKNNQLIRDNKIIE